MKVILKSKQNKSLTATDPDGLETHFDSSIEHGGDGSASSPMVVMLEAMAACSFMDVMFIIKKQRKRVDELQVIVDSKRAEEHPKVYTSVHLHYILKSPDAEQKDLDRAMELSQSKFCSASAMFQRSGCEVSWDGEIVKD